jgi:(2Fe-2S) ferredoxin
MTDEAQPSLIPRHRLRRLECWPIEDGSLVYVKYLDHCWFRNVDPKLAKPVVQEAWGLLEEETPDHVKLIASSYTDPTARRNASRATGLVILRSTVIELRSLDTEDAGMVSVKPSENRSYRQNLTRAILGPKRLPPDQASRLSSLCKARDARSARANQSPRRSR